MEEQQVVVVDQQFICRAIINEVFRLGGWEYKRPAHCRIVFGVDLDALPEAARPAMETLLDIMGRPDFSLNFVAQLRPMYSAEEVAGAMDCG